MLTFIILITIGGLYVYGKWGGAMWLATVVLMDLYFSCGNEKCYREIIEDYPVEDCIKPRRYKFLFKNLNRLSYKDIPKEMYFSALVVFIGFLVYTPIGFISSFYSEILSAIIGWIYIFIVYGIDIVCIFVMTRKSFLSRFQMMNIHNFKYIFSPQNAPYPRKIGRCHIMKEQRKGKRTFVTVCMMESGEIIDKVLLRGKKRQGENPFYSIYEICGVYYIV